MKWNLEEFVVGSVVMLSFAGFLHGWALLAPLCGLLWMWGGQYRKEYRRYGVPILLTTALYLATQYKPVFFSIPPMIIILSMGYGIPDSTDAGSALGRFFYNTLKIRPDWKADIFTRGTIALLLGLVLFPLSFINTATYWICVLALTISVPATVVTVP